MPILYIRKVISYKADGQNSAKQAHRIWRKKYYFQALPSNYILGVGSFFCLTLYMCAKKYEKWLR